MTRPAGGSLHQAAAAAAAAGLLSRFSLCLSLSPDFSLSLTHCEGSNGPRGTTSLEERRASPTLRLNDEPAVGAEASAPREAFKKNSGAC